MECSFCGREIPRGTENILVTKRGKALYFCAKKCEKNLMKLERKPRDTKWTQEYRDEKAIRIKGAASAASLAPVKEKKEALKKEEAPMTEDAKVEKKTEAKSEASKAEKKADAKVEAGAKMHKPEAKKSEAKAEVAKPEKKSEAPKKKEEKKKK